MDLKNLIILSITLLSLVFIFKKLNSLQTVGYKEFFNYFEGKCNYKKTIDEISDEISDLIDGFKG